VRARRVPRVEEVRRDGDFDMDLVVERILNQHSVIFDPFAKEQDWSDGEWCVLFTDVPDTEYRRRWRTLN
jgi:hypothetical protein